MRVGLKPDLRELRFDRGPDSDGDGLGVAIGVYDPTMYTAIDFAKDEDMVTEGEGFRLCKRAVIRPDPDQVLAENQANLTSAFFDDPAGTDMTKLFATRLELTC